jgi:hypothetical protein
MAFEQKWSSKVRAILTARVLDTDDSAAIVHEIALAGAVRGVDPADVPPLKTLQGWCTEERKVRQTAEDVQTLDGMASTLEEVYGMGALALRAEAQRLNRRRPRATPEDWARLLKAAEQLAKTRRAIDGPEPRKRPSSSAPAEGDAPAETPRRGFLQSLDPDA